MVRLLHDCSDSLALSYGPVAGSFVALEELVACLPADIPEVPGTVEPLAADILDKALLAEPSSQPAAE